MKHTNTIFHQLLKNIPRHRFEAVVKRHKGDYRTRSLSCWQQFIVLLFAQLGGCRSLRDVVSAWGSHARCHYHVGGRMVKRSTLADANGSRPYQIYFELFHWLLGQARSGAGKEMVRLIDSTTIDLCKQRFEWAHFRSGKAGVKMHTVYDPDAGVPTFFSITTAKCHDRKAARNLPLMPGATYVFDRAYNDYTWFNAMCEQDIRFVTRMKSNTQFETVEPRKVTEYGVREDAMIRLTSARGKELCPRLLRRICFTREEDGKQLVFITNDLDRSAGEIAELYKLRWQIELFFKWIKQNLKIKAFFGTSENAVKIQIIIAMTAYLLLHMASRIIPNNRTMRQLARLVTTNLMIRRNFLELLVDNKPPNPPDPSPHQEQMILIQA
jgi:hypothetical protein